MKIAYIVLKGMPLGGGIENWTAKIGSILVEKGHEVIVYTMNHYNTKNCVYKGMKIKTVPTLRTKGFEKITASLLSTFLNCFDKNVDIVHFHAFGPAMFSFIPRLMGKKVVVQGHGLEWKRSRWGFAGKLFLKLSEIPSVKFCNVLTVVSEVQRKYIKEKYGKDSVCIMPGVDYPTVEKPDLIKQYGIYGNDYIFFAGRLVREKGAHLLIEAYNKLNTNLKLLIAGDAQHENKYKSLLYKLANNNKNIIFTGYATGKLLSELFSNCYIFVQPSELEGLPATLLEAMSYGKCCLASDIEENKEAVKQYGYTFQSGNVNSLAEMLEKLITNPSLVEENKDAASEYVLKNFSWNKIADEIEKLYEMII